MMLIRLQKCKVASIKMSVQDKCHIFILSNDTMYDLKNFVLSKLTVKKLTESGRRVAFMRTELNGTLGIGA
jgi:hypothetical protein